MLIKTDKFELEISQGVNVYIGSRKTGQTFKKWADIDDDAKAGLERIVKQAERLIKHSEELLLTTKNN
jgi:hypothetical protein